MLTIDSESTASPSPDSGRDEEFDDLLARLHGIDSYPMIRVTSLSRYVRDACSAVLMVGNDRTMPHNSTLLPMHEEEA